MSGVLKSFFSFNDDQVSDVQSHLNRLTIELGKYHVSYMISRIDGQAVSKLEVLGSEKKIGTAAIEEFIGHLGTLEKDFTSAHLVLNNGVSTLVPAALFREEEAESILNILFTDESPRKVFGHKIPNWGLVALSGIPSLLYEMLQARFQLSSVMPISAGYLASKDIDGLDEQTQIVKMFFYPGSFTLLIIRGKSLQLIQDHDYQTMHDVTYALLQACHQTGIETESAYLKISGFISEDASLFNDLLKLFRNTSLESPSLFVGDVSHTSPHIFTPYLHSLSCV